MDLSAAPASVAGISGLQIVAVAEAANEATTSNSLETLICEIPLL
jgi:hypothetical protein